VAGTILTGLSLLTFVLPAEAAVTFNTVGLTRYQMFTGQALSGDSVTPTWGMVGTFFQFRAYELVTPNDTAVGHSILVNGNEYNYGPPGTTFNTAVYYTGQQLLNMGGVGLGSSPVTLSITLRLYTVDANGNLTTTNITASSVTIYPIRIRMHPVDDTGNYHKAVDNSGGRLQGFPKGGLIVDPVDPQQDDEGTTSSVYTFRVRFSDDNRPPLPAPFMHDVYDSHLGEGDPWEWGGHFVTPVMIVIDDVAHFMQLESGDWLNGTYVYKVRPTNQNVDSRGDQADNNYFALGPGYHRYYYKAATDLVMTDQDYQLSNVTSRTFTISGGITLRDGQAAGREVMIYSRDPTNDSRPTVPLRYYVSNNTGNTLTISWRLDPLYPVDPNVTLSSYWNPNLTQDGVVNGNYAILGSYQLRYESGDHVYWPNELVWDTDRPDLPSQYHTFVNFGLRYCGVTDSGTPNSQMPDSITGPVDTDMERRFYDPFWDGVARFITEWNPFNAWKQFTGDPQPSPRWGSVIPDTSDVRDFPGGSNGTYDPDFYTTNGQALIRGTFHSRSRGTKDTEWTFWANFVSAHGSLPPNDVIDDQSPLRVRVHIFDANGQEIPNSPFLMKRSQGPDGTPHQSPNDGNWSNNFSDKFAQGNYSIDVMGGMAPPSPWWQDNLPDNPVDIDYDLSKGEWYYHTMTLPEGQYSYSFEADDTVRTTIFPRRPDRPHEATDPGNWLRDLRVDRVPQLTDGGVTPPMGHVGETFTYRVTYTDADGDIPRDAYVNIITVPRTKWTRFQNNVPTSGQATITDIYAHFTEDSLAGAFVELFDANGDALDADGNPLRKFEDSQSDPDNVNLPRVISNTATTIVVDKNIGSASALPTQYRVRVRATMELESGSPASGAVYKYEFNQFPNLGTFGYYFRFVDNWGSVVEPEPGVFVTFPPGDADGNPSRVIPGPIIADDIPPILSASQNTNDNSWDTTVMPPEATVADTFRYQVYYTDEDNDPPAYVRVRIQIVDVDANGNEIRVAAFNDYDMAKVNPSDNLYTAGVAYYYDTKLALLPTSQQYRFQYYASDGVRGNVYPDGAGNFVPDLTETSPPGRPATHTLPKGVGPIVNPINRDPQLTNGMVSPVVDDPGQPFTFSVTYTDPDDDPPTSIHVYIQDSTGAAVADSEMQAVDPNDLVFTDGKVYAYTTTALTAGRNYRFHFETTDGRISGVIRLPEDPVGPALPVDPTFDVNTPPLLRDPAPEPLLNPLSGPQNQDFTYKVLYRDADGDAPAAIDVIVLDANRDLVAREVMAPFNPPAPTAGDYRAGVVFRATITGLAPGNYFYAFETSDGVDEAALSSKQVESGRVQQVDSATRLTAVKADGTPFAWTADQFKGHEILFFRNDARGRPVSKAHVLSNGASTVTNDGTTPPIPNRPFDDLHGNGVPDSVVGAQFAIWRPFTGQTVKVGNEPRLRYGRFAPVDGQTGQFTSDGAGGNVADDLTVPDGETTTDFEFRVRYQDNDDDPPALLDVVITKPDGTPFGVFGMVLVDPNSPNYVAGEEFRSGVIHLPSPGLYSYQFRTKDGSAQGYSVSTAVSAAVPPDPANPGMFPVAVNDPCALSAAATPLAPATDATHPGWAGYTQFTYQVVFTDPDGDNPLAARSATDPTPRGHVRVHILDNNGNEADLDGDSVADSPLDMTPVAANPTADDFKAGVTFQAAGVTFATAGTYQYYFEADDWDDAAYPELDTGSRLPSSGTTSGPVVVANAAPTLEDPAPTLILDPTSGTTSNVYTYNIKYRDAEGDPPAYVKVFIDGTGYDMTPPPSPNYVTGAVFTYQAGANKALELAEGPHTYHFEAQAKRGVDARILYDNGGTLDDPIDFIGPQINYKPTLTNPDDENDPNGTVTPTQGSELTVFTYRVRYKDRDGDAPSGLRYPVPNDAQESVTDVQVVIDGVAHDMTRQDSEQFAKGTLYAFSLSGLAVSPPVHTFYFRTKDGRDVVETKLKTGPDPVVAGGKAPSLTDLTNANVVVTPEAVATEPFPYVVRYQDQDNTPPASILVHVLNPSGGELDVNGDGVPESPFALGPDPADPRPTDYVGGVLYRYDLTTLPVGRGLYAYYYEVTDTDPGGGHSSRSPARGTTPGPTVNTPPVLANPSVTTSGSWSEIVYRVTYRDADGDAPVAGYPQVRIDQGARAKAMTPAMANPTPADFQAGVIYTAKLSQKLAVGDHTYIIEASDGLDLVQTWRVQGLVQTVDSPTQFTARRLDGAPFTWTANAFAGSQIKFFQNLRGNVKGREIAGTEATITGNGDSTITAAGANFTQPNVQGRQFAIIGTELVGPRIVTKPPVLSLVGNNGFTAPTNNPEPVPDAEVGGNVTFEIKYQDPDGDMPRLTGSTTGVQITLTDPTGAQTTFDLDPVKADYTEADYIAGAVFKRTQTFAVPGLYAYSFNTGDGVYSAAPVSESGQLRVNTAPTLTEVAAPDLEVSPAQGSSNTIFQYLVVYADADGNAPDANVGVKLFISDEQGRSVATLNMEKRNAADSDFVGGVTYRATYRLANLGTYQYHFEADDFDEATYPALTAKVRRPEVGELSGPTVQKNTPPELFDAGFAPDKTPDPDGIDGATFTFQVTYKDVNNDPPSPAVELHVLDEKGNEVDLDGDGDPDSPFDMTTTDTTYQDGSIHTYSVALVGGTYTFYVTASDGTDTARLPATGGLAGPVVNHKPVLSEAPNYPLVTPARGSAVSTTFTWQVLYTDADNHAPTKGRPVVIINGTSYDMAVTTDTNAPAAYRDGVWTNGELFQYQRKLPEGPSTYYFQASDGYQTVTLGSKDNPYTITVNRVPVLSDKEPPTATGGTYPTVTSSSGNNRSTDDYIFRITYADADNDKPTQIQVIIDGTAQDMKWLDPAEEPLNDGSYLDGEMFEYRTKLAEGPHHYYFTASDGIDSTSFPVKAPATKISGPQVNYRPVLSRDAITAGNGYHYEVYYFDQDNVAPAAPDGFVRLELYQGVEATGKLVLKQTYEMLPEASTGYGTQPGVKYTVTVPDSVYVSGVPHAYVIRAHDGVEEAVAIGPVERPVLNQKPVLTPMDPLTQDWDGAVDGVDPDDGTRSTKFTFRVRYRDPDGWPTEAEGLPAGAQARTPTVNLVLDGVAYPMRLAAGQTLDDASVQQGVTFEYVADPNATPPTGLTGGTHAFHFEASDGLGQADPTTSTTDRPYVHRPPTLSGGKVTPVDGASNADYLFEVTYRDLDEMDARGQAQRGDPPQSIRVVIAIANGTLAKNLTQDSNDSDLLDGATFSVAINGTELGGGAHTYHFEATDVFAEAAAPTADAEVYVNRKPILSEVSITSTSSQNRSDDEYTYRVKYTDLDTRSAAPNGDAPASIQVVIGGADTLTATLKKVDENDNDYTDGVVYEYQTPLRSGAHTYEFRANDGTEDAAPLSGSGPQVNFPPDLPGVRVDPSSGFSTDTYTFRVTVEDEDNVAPKELTLTIFDGQGTAVETVDLLTDGTPNGANFADGVTYTYERTGAQLGGGAHSFHVQVVNSANETKAATVNGPQVNRVPTLSPVLDANGQALPYVTSSSGKNLSADTYTYKVLYTDLDNNPPSSVEVEIGGADTVTKTLSKADPNDNDYTDGVQYTLATELSGGDHTFRFLASDNAGEKTDGNGQPIQDPQGHPILIREAATPVTGNEPHVNRVPTLFGDKVTPKSGVQAGTYTFEVRYADADNQAPQWLTAPDQNAGVRVFLKDAKGRITGYNLKPKDPTDETYTDGAVYQLVVGPNGDVQINPGTYSYYFQAADGLETSTPTEMKTDGFHINAAPALGDVKVDPVSGTPETEFVFSAWYSDADGNGPLYVKLFLDNPNEAEGVGQVVQMAHTVENPNYVNGVKYSAKLKLTVGAHSFHVTAHDRTETVSSEEVQQPTVNGPPVLTDGRVTPTKGSEQADYTFSVLYTDADWKSGDPDPVVEVLIDSVAHVLSPPAESPDYRAGARFEYVAPAGTLEPGKHSFYFRGSDKVNPPVDTSATPGEVVVNHAPTLTNPDVSPDEGGEGTQFVFSVTFTDLDGDAPDANGVRLFIDGSTTGLPMSMAGASQAEPNYKTGVRFERLQSLAAGSHTFEIRASDGLDEATTGPISGPAVDHTPELLDSFLSPDQGTEATEFTFQVRYKDQDNDEPEYVKAIVGDIGYTMQKADPTDKDYRTGVLYQLTTPFAKGTYSHYFEASDGSSVARLPATGALAGPTVTEASTLAGGSVLPTTGDTNTKFTYRVTFTGKNRPQKVEVVIDGRRRSMQQQDPADENYADGAVFVYEANPDTDPPTGLAAGSHSFHFEADDGVSVLRLPREGELSGPSVSQGATLALEIPAEVQLGQRVSIVGHLAQQPGARITVTITNPENAPQQFSLVADSQGSFQHDFTPLQSGAWTVVLSWPGNAQFNAVTRTRTVNVRPSTSERPLAQGLHLLTVPVMLRNLDQITALDVFVGASPNTVRLARWLPLKASYNILNRAEADFFGPGKGFWVEFQSQTGGAIAPVADGTIVDQATPFDIPTEVGWNQIGSPFLQTVDWAAAQVRYGTETLSLADAEKKGWVRSFAWYYVPERNEYGLIHATAINATRAVRPWQGLWFRSFVPATLILRPVPYTSFPEPPRARAELGSGDWMATLVASAGQATDTYNYFGVVSGATGLVSSMPIEAPPVAAGYVDLSFVDVSFNGTRLAGRYATDVRPTPAEKLEWVVEVTTDLAGQPVTLTWPDLTSVPSGCRLTLTDLTTHETRALKTTSHYTFQPDESGRRRFRLAAETGREGSLAPQNFRIDTAGGRGAALVSFTLPQGALVDVEILAPGTQQVIRTLAQNRSAEAGLNTLTWEGTDEQGRPLPNGVYLGRLRVKAEDGQQVQSITRFTISR